MYRLHRSGQRRTVQPDNPVHVTENGLSGWHTVIVPRFEPFAALRYRATPQLGDLCAPPYDVQSDKDRERFGLRHQHNIVHIDMPIGADEGNTRYRGANELLRAWIDSGVLVRDESPSFTLYRMHFRDTLGRARSTVGVIGALEVVDEGAGGVLPHERTTPKAKTDRLELTRATRTNMSPVWGLSLAPGLTALLASPGEPCGEYEDDLGVVHTVERVTDPERIAAISACISAQPVLIADGHHRYAISRTYRDEIRAETASRNSAAELTLTYVNELIDEQLSVAAIHRLYRNVSFDALHSALHESFHLEPLADLRESVLAEMDRDGFLTLLSAEGPAFRMTPRQNMFEGVRDLDSARLEHALRNLDHVVEYQHGFDEVHAAVTGSDYTAGVLIRPVSINEIRRTANEGLLMPPKSTFFTPKLQTGLVIRELN